MKQFFKKSSLYTVLFVAFVDNVGIGLIYPLFSSMLFDTKAHFLPPETSHALRGWWLGILIALMPLSQFFSAPIWGAISDGKGRKKPLHLSLAMTLVGYLIALGGVLFKNLSLLLLSRVVIGVAAGNMAIVQATIVDLSREEEKAKNFGLYNMALGAGFTLGPFFGGALSSFGYSVPFIFAAVLILINWAIAYFYFQESHHTPVTRKLHWDMGLIQLKKAFHYPGFRTILACSFLHNFGWSFFFEFIPVYLISIFSFTSLKLGFFYAAAGGYYALSAGLLIRPFVKRLKPETLFFAGMLLTSFVILLLPLLPQEHFIWFLLFFICFFVSFVMPTATTIVSNDASPHIQGEVLGILSSVNAASLAISPIFSGSMVGRHSSLPMWIGGSVMLLGALCALASFRARLFKKL